MCKLAQMHKLMPALDWWDFATPKTYIICLGCSTKAPQLCKTKLPIMELTEMAISKTENVQKWTSPKWKDSFP